VNAIVLPSGDQAARPCRYESLIVLLGEFTESHDDSKKRVKRNGTVSVSFFMRIGIR
jgi:hypothetical protein